MPELTIINTPDGRALEYGDNTAPLPALATDATVHAYAVPEGVWVGAQQTGEPRPVYPGAGGTRLGSIELPADPDAAERARHDDLAVQLEPLRKEQEAIGVTVNGIRYSGDPSNRQALGESLQFASAANASTFAGWKDSDGAYHADHPVADVQQAYEAIGHRRSALIAKEGEYAAQIYAGMLTDLSSLGWLDA